MKQVYVVLGLPRSGTSAIARGLAALGINLGDRLQPPDHRNPKGFYEDLDIMYKINRGVSRVWSQDWMSLDVDPDLFETNAELRSFRNYASDLLSKRLADSEAWGFKDPRTNMLMPFWKAVFKTLNVDDRYIIVVRHPLAAAHSLQKFTDVDIESGLILWIKFLVNAIEATHGKKRVLVHYERMLQDPRAQLMRMHSQLGILGALNEDDISSYANGFLDSRLQRHQFSDDDLLTHPAVSVVPACTALYSFALRLAKDELLFDTEAFHQAWAEVKDQLAKTQPISDYILALRQKNKNLEREVRVIKKSLPWKMIAPLRLIDDLLRSRRRQFRRKLES